ncbi:MAG: hypothetical protein KA923_07650, partial [Opitutaceae bacterium]|nr:hypothetical protein [Opitutaceae bacterium]
MESVPLVDSAPPQRRPWIRRLIRIPIATTLLMVATLLWPGWPLHPVAALARSFAAKDGVMLDARSPWLRVHLDGTARCTIDSATIGDAAAPEALALRAVQLRWRLRDLVHAHWLP